MNAGSVGALVGFLLSVGTISFAQQRTQLPRLLNRAEVLKTVQAMYPAAEKLAGHEATLSINILIDSNGTVVGAQIQHTAGVAFDTAALKVAQNMRFSPAYNASGSTSSKLVETIEFKLEKNMAAPTSIPSDHSDMVVIIETVPRNCEGWRYKGPRHNFSTTEWQWLEILMRFAHSSRGSLYVTESNPAKPVSDAQIRQLLDDPAFTAWAGTETIHLVNALLNIRPSFESQKFLPKLIDPKTGKEISRRMPAINLKYKETRDSLIAQFSNRFKIQREDISNCIDE